MGDIYVLWIGVIMQPFKQTTTANDIRLMRDIELSKCDWRVGPDSPLSNSKKAEWQTFRQALRDITAQSGFPTNVTWPTKPS